MKEYVIYLMLLFSFALHAQDVNTKKGYAAEGYDVVAYFDGQAIEGRKAYTAIYKDVKYQFANAKNAKTFQSNPEAFVPQYGGFCAYAVATSAKKVGVNPKSFQIKDGKLYLFYDSVFADTLEKWNEEGPTLLQKKADENWKKITMKKN